MIIPTDKITASEGILAALGTVAANLGIGPWFIRIIAFGISLSVLGAIILYIASPIKMLFGSVKKEYLQRSLQRLMNTIYLYKQLYYKRL